MVFIKDNESDLNGNILETDLISIHPQSYKIKAFLISVYAILIEVLHFSWVFFRIWKTEVLVLPV